MKNDDFLKVAKKAALEAGKIISKYSGSQHKLVYKEGDKSNFATKVDFDTEKVIVSILSKSFPNHNIFGEEETKINNNSEFSWMIDPLDGSFSFSLGIPTYSISIGLLQNNEPILGVIYNVSFKNLYWAQKGKGAFLNGKKISVTRKKRLDQAGVVLDFGHRLRRQQKYDWYIGPLMNRIGYLYSFGSSVYILAMIAQGMLDADCCDAWIWDFVAGVVIVREAGGKVTDFEGNEPDWSKERLSIVASNGLIHNQILEALR
ncbi:MAG: inositol monophosphatase family protein [Patescibacteria group bacterium]